MKDYTNISIYITFYQPNFNQILTFVFILYLQHSISFETHLFFQLLEFTMIIKPNRFLKELELHCKFILYNINVVLVHSLIISYTKKLTKCLSR